MLQNHEKSIFQKKFYKGVFKSSLKKNKKKRQIKRTTKTAVLFKQQHRNLTNASLLQTVAFLRILVEGHMEKLYNYRARRQPYTALTFISCFRFFSLPLSTHQCKNTQLYTTKKRGTVKSR